MAFLFSSSLSFSADRAVKNGAPFLTALFLSYFPFHTLEEDVGLLIFTVSDGYAVQLRDRPKHVDVRPRAVRFIPRNSLARHTKPVGGLLLGHIPAEPERAKIISQCHRLSPQANSRKTDGSRQARICCAARFQPSAEAGASFAAAYAATKARAASTTCFPLFSFRLRQGFVPASTLTRPLNSGRA